LSLLFCRHSLWHARLCTLFFSSHIFLQARNLSAWAFLYAFIYSDLSFGVCPRNLASKLSGRRREKRKKSERLQVG
jgi:hypothetical protein